jgi:tetratricopeptide (TPR) repeat protein
MKKIILGALVLSTTFTFAQRKNTTNAAMSYNDAQKSLQQGKFEPATVALLEAKKYIDLAVAHEDTKSDAKTLMYKGKIYLEVGAIGSMAKNETVMAMDLEKLAEEGVSSLKSVKPNDKKDRYGDDVKSYCNKLKYQGYNVGIQMFQDKKYEEAIGGFSMSSTFADIIGETDSASYFNTGLAAFNIEKWDVVEASFKKCVEIGYKPGSSISYLTEAYIHLDKKTEAEVMLKEQVIKNPGNKDIMISLINIYLGQDKKVEAEKVLTDAIALDPESRDLNYAVATVYENLERYEDAEKAYKKVIEIDPSYSDALLGLGAVYFNKAADLNGKINDLQPGDPQEEVYRASMKDNFSSSLPYLEKANELTPNNKEILNSLKQVYYKLGNIVKFREIKAQLGAL